MTVIKNFSNPVPVSSLSTAELIVTLALILRGNYTGKNRAYITFRGARDTNSAQITISNACNELGIPFKQLPCDKSKYRYYLWNTTLELVLAKQGILPERLSWKHFSRIPTSWKDLGPDKLRILERLTSQMLVPRIYKNKQIYLINDDTFFKHELHELFRPIIPDIEMEFSESLKKPYISGITYSSSTYASEDLLNDDFSDLM